MCVTFLWWFFYTCHYLADHGHTGLHFPGFEMRVKHFNSDQLCFFILSSKDIDQTIQLHHTKVLTGLQQWHDSQMKAMSHSFNYITFFFYVLKWCLEMGMGIGRYRYRYTKLSTADHQQIGWIIYRSYRKTVKSQNFWLIYWDCFAFPSKSICEILDTGLHYLT